MPKVKVTPSECKDDEADWNPNPNCYELLAPFYADIYGEIDADETVRQWWQLLTEAKLVSIPPNALRLVDIGCGPGWQLQAWQKLGCTVAGIDSSPTLLSSARMLLESNHGKADLYEANMLDASSLPHLPPFDLAVSHFNFLNLFSHRQRELLFRSVYRLLRPGGLWIVDFSEPLTTPEPAEETFNLSGGGQLQRKSYYNKALGCYDLYWQTPLNNIQERFWFGHYDSAEALAARTGWQLRLRKAWHPYMPEAPWHEPSKKDEVLVDVYQKMAEG